MTTALYDTDFYIWATRQADLLRNEDYAELDRDNLIEEIEAMAKRDRRELESRIRGILTHLLKWKYQPNRRSSSWTNSIDEQRDQIEPILKDSPSLRRELPDMIVDAYATAIRKAAKQTKLPVNAFPARCEWTLEQILDEDFLP